jgi:hypothetical protein
MFCVSNNENKIKYFINKLPQDIVNKIYMEYINPELVCTELNLILNSTDSIEFRGCEQLTEFLKKRVLNNKIVVKYLNKNNQIFQKIYKDHIIDGNKTFVKIPDLEYSLALSWLMYLYH